MTSKNPIVANALAEREACNEGKYIPYGEIGDHFFVGMVNCQEAAKKSPDEAVRDIKSANIEVAKVLSMSNAPREYKQMAMKFVQETTAAMKNPNAATIGKAVETSKKAFAMTEKAAKNSCACNACADAVAENENDVKVGEKCKWKNGPFEWKGVLVGGKPGNWKLKTDDGKEQVWHGSIYKLDEKYQYTHTPFGSFVNSCGENSTACNAPHFSGRCNDLADKIVKQFDKWDRTQDDSDKFQEEKKLWEIVRSATSLGGGVWLMRDGTIAITKDKPRGAQNFSEYIKSLNSCDSLDNADPEAPVAKNGYQDSPSFKKRKMLEFEIERIITRLKGDLSKMKNVAESAYKTYQKSDPENAYFVEEVEGWIKGLERAIEEVW